MRAENAKNGSEAEPKEVEHGGKVIADQILILLISKADGIMTRHRGRYQFPDDAFADAISPLHLCSVNWTLRLSCASATLFMAVRGTLNSRLQKVQTPMARSVPSHLVTLRLRDDGKPLGNLNTIFLVLVS